MKQFQKVLSAAAIAVTVFVGGTSYAGGEDWNPKLPAHQKNLIDVSNNTGIKLTYSKNGDWKFIYPTSGILRYTAEYKSLLFSNDRDDSSTLMECEDITSSKMVSDFNGTVRAMKATEYWDGNFIAISFYPSGKVGAISLGYRDDLKSGKGVYLVAVFKESGKVEWAEMDKGHLK